MWNNFWTNWATEVRLDSFFRFFSVLSTYFGSKMTGAMGTRMERTKGLKITKNGFFMEKMHKMSKECWLSPPRNWIKWEGIRITYFDFQELIEGIRSRPLGCSKCAIRGQNCDFNRKSYISAHAAKEKRWDCRCRFARVYQRTQHKETLPSSLPYHLWSWYSLTIWMREKEWQVMMNVKP